MTSRTSWQVHRASFGMHILSVPRPALVLAFVAAIQGPLMKQITELPMPACHRSGQGCGVALRPAGNNLLGLHGLLGRVLCMAKLSLRISILQDFRSHHHCCKGAAECLPCRNRHAGGFATAQPGNPGWRPAVQSAAQLWRLSCQKCYISKVAYASGVCLAYISLS